MHFMQYLLDVNPGRAFIIIFFILRIRICISLLLKSKDLFCVDDIVLSF